MRRFIHLDLYHFLLFLLIALAVVVIIYLLPEIYFGWGLQALNDRRYCPAKDNLKQTMEQFNRPWSFVLIKQPKYPFYLAVVQAMNSKYYSKEDGATHCGDYDKDSFDAEAIANYGTAEQWGDYEQVGRLRKELCQSHYDDQYSTLIELLELKGRSVGPDANCSTPDATPTPTTTETPTAAVTPTSIAAATATPSPSETPSAVAPAACIHNLEFKKDVTLPDGTQLAPGEQRTKTWLVRNTGNCPWDGSVTLAFYGGDRLSDEESVPIEFTPPDGFRNISINVTTPKQPGRYEARYSLQSADGKFFGDVIAIVIEVRVTPTPAPVPTDTRIPTYTPTNIPTQTPTPKFISRQGCSAAQNWIEDFQIIGVSQFQKLRITGVASSPIFHHYQIWVKHADTEDWISIGEFKEANGNNGVLIDWRYLDNGFTAFETIDMRLWVHWINGNHSDPGCNVQFILPPIQ